MKLPKGAVVLFAAGVMLGPAPSGCGSDSDDDDSVAAGGTPSTNDAGSSTNGGSSGGDPATGLTAEEEQWLAATAADCLPDDVHGGLHLDQWLDPSDGFQPNPNPIDAAFDSGVLVEVDGHTCHPMLAWPGNGAPNDPPVCPGCAVSYVCDACYLEFNLQSGFNGFLLWQIQQHAWDQPDCWLGNDNHYWAIPMFPDPDSCVMERLSECSPQYCPDGFYCGDVGYCEVGSGGSGGGSGGGGTTVTRSECDECLDSCQGLASCCMGMGCICESACDLTGFDTCPPDKYRCCRGGFCLCLSFSEAEMSGCF